MQAEVPLVDKDNSWFTNIQVIHGEGVPEEGTPRFSTRPELILVIDGCPFDVTVHISHVDGGIILTSYDEFGHLVTTKIGEAS